MDIDLAYERFRQLVAEIPADDERPINESATRLRLIDPILVDVLGWPRLCIETELPAGEGKDEGRARLDYLLRDALGTGWFVVEAKKREHKLVDPSGPWGTFKLSGPVLKDRCWPIIDAQMSPYLGRHMPRFGIVTNGQQWIGFLNALRPPHLDLADTKALTFRSLKDIDEGFERFYNAFSVEGVQRGYLHRLLVEEPGVVPCASPFRGVALDQNRPIDYHPDDAGFYEELRRAVQAAFNPLQRDPAALTMCFVESQQSREADSRLARMQTELEEVIRDAAGYPERVDEEVQLHSGQAPASIDPGELRGQGCLVRLLGERSAGKTVFLKRFYDTQLEASKRKHVALIWIDAEEFEPFEPNRVSAAALAKLKAAIFGEEGPDWAQLREVYARDWSAWTRVRSTPRDAAPREMQQEFAADRVRQEEASPTDALERYADFAVRNRRLLPCFVVDNADSAEKSRRAAEWALAIHLRSFALTTVAMEDVTLWRLRSSDADDLARHSPEQFWLSRPKIRDVIERRCAYLKSVLLGGKGGEGAAIRTRVGYLRQFRWTVNPDELVRVVSAVLLDDPDISTWLGKVCNYDIHDVLELCKQIVLSPRVKASALLTSQSAQKPLHRRNVLKAIISPKNEQFQATSAERVMNIFGLWLDQRWAPLLPARILAFLARREDDESGRKEPFPGFVQADRLCSLFERELGTPGELTSAALERMRTMRLLESYDPSRTTASGPGAKVKVTPRGRLHLEWCRESTYIRMMAEVDSIADPAAAQQMRNAWDAFLGAGGLGPERTRRMSEAERELNRCYVRYLLEQARRVTPTGSSDEIAPLREMEQGLHDAWVRQGPG